MKRKKMKRKVSLTGYLKLLLILCQLKGILIKTKILMSNIVGQEKDQIMEEATMIEEIVLKEITKKSHHQEDKMIVEVKKRDLKIIKIKENIMKEDLIIEREEIQKEMILLKKTIKVTAQQVFRII
jgi:hypothetical protein